MEAPRLSPGQAPGGDLSLTRPRHLDSRTQTDGEGVTGLRALARQPDGAASRRNAQTKPTVIKARTRNLPRRLASLNHVTLLAGRVTKQGVGNADAQGEALR